MILYEDDLHVYNLCLGLGRYESLDDNFDKAAVVMNKLFKL